jgi:hypothetical protein
MNFIRGVSFREDTFKWVEANRGDVPRSTFVNRLILDRMDGKKK